MNARATVALGLELFRCFRRERTLSRRLLGSFSDLLRGSEFTETLSTTLPRAGTPCDPHASPNIDSGNPLWRHFAALDEGPGIFKWLHYFDIYHRHFSKFVGREVHIMEVGVYSGGSLEMWKAYFGPDCHIYGVDIEDACRMYEGERTKILIGDQVDRAFWQRVKAEVPRVDLLIDDGGHLPEQQIVTMEEMLPHLAPGGIFMCEDVHGVYNPFSSFTQRFVDGLHAVDQLPPDGSGNIYLRPTALQETIHSVHVYPFVTIVEKRDAPLTQLACVRHGTHWQPFL